MPLPGNMDLRTFGELVVDARKGTASIQRMRQLPTGYWVKPDEYFLPSETTCAADELDC